MWLHKSVINEGVGFATDAKISARNMYAFWIPLDEKFLDVMTKYAQVYNVNFISPFEASIFFAYLNYSSRTANVPYAQARQVMGQVAGQNIAKDIVSPLACYYQGLIVQNGPISTSLSLYPFGFAIPEVNLEQSVKPFIIRLG